MTELEKRVNELTTRVEMLELANHQLNQLYHNLWCGVQVLNNRDMLDRLNKLEAKYETK